MRGGESFKGNEEPDKVQTEMSADLSGFFLEEGKMKNGNFTEGKIFGPLLSFSLPVLLALLLQSLYGAGDLFVVGQFGTSSDVSAVSTGAQVMQTLTNVIAGLAMGTTVLLGQQIGKKESDRAGCTVGTSICFFMVLAVVLSAAMVLLADQTAAVMHAPKEAYEATVSYIRICSLGLIFIVGYNLIGSLFRGLGNSMLPLLTVAVAAVFNIFGDLLLVAGLGMGAAGAACATVASQALSVLFSFLLVRRLDLPFSFSRRHLKPIASLAVRIAGLGFPIALADLLVGISFLVILAIVNTLGVTASAGIGVAEKVSAFIMRVPSAFGQSMAAFVAQNYGAGKIERAEKALFSGIAASFAFGAVMGLTALSAGNVLCGIFSSDPQVIQAGWDYLKAYAIDCFLTPFFFNFAGFFNGCGMTKFVMAENIIGGIGVRLPLSWLLSRIRPVSLFRIGLATPSSSFLQTVLCVIAFVITRRRRIVYNKKREGI